MCTSHIDPSNQERLDVTVVVDYDDVQDPLPWPLDIPDQPGPPPQPPAPPVPPAPAPAPAPIPNPAPPPAPQPAVDPPRANHRRARHVPVGDAGPSIARDRPRRENAGRNPGRNQDNVYGDEPPAQVDARTDADGHQAEALLAFLAASQYKAGLPNSHRDARKSPEAGKWQIAEKAEYDSLLENKTCILVPRPKDRQVVSNRWVYDIKHDGHYKARLVVKGFTQVWGEDYHETFSPVVIVIKFFSERFKIYKEDASVMLAI